VTGRLDPPRHYDAERRATWDSVVSRLTDAGGVFRADPEVINTYVEAVAAHTQACQLRAQTNVMITRGDRAVENPALAIQRRAAADIAKASRALGLHRTPMTAALAESPMSGDGRRWCETHQRDECKHNRKDGEPCHQYQLIPGLGSCRKHAGLTLAAAREKGQVALARMYGEPADVVPGEALLEEVRFSAGHVRDLRAKVAEIAGQAGEDGELGSGLWWGVVKETVDGDGTVARESRAGPNVVLQAYQLERRHLVTAASAAHTAGAQQAAVDAARQVGAGLARLLDAIFTALELTEYQRGLVPERVPALVRAWQPGELTGGPS
jgi:P27 family predicted phage terminase small subunit